MSDAHSIFAVQTQEAEKKGKLRKIVSVFSLTKLSSDFLEVIVQTEGKTEEKK